MKVRRLIALIAFCWSGATIDVAVASIELVQQGQWSVSTDGRLNAFFSHAQGTGLPEKAPNYTGLWDEDTTGNRIVSTRFRTGFMTSVLAFNLTRTITESLRVRGRVGLWLLASGGRAKDDTPPADVRELYLIVEGRHGFFLAGREMTIFARGGAMLNFELGHGEGLGHPCGTRQVTGGACGHVGHGILFPTFNAGMVLGTPADRAVQAVIGAYDPATIPLGQFERTPLPRVEAALKLRLGRFGHAFADAMWQRLSRNVEIDGEDRDLDVAAHGLGAGASLRFGALSLGFAHYRGRGLGPFFAIQNSPSLVDDAGNLRSSQGLYGQAALRLGDAKVAIGAGQMRMDKTPNDPDIERADTPIIRQHRGYSLGYYHRLEPLIVALEYFRAEYVWHDFGIMNATGTKIDVFRPRQAVNFMNAGVTFVW